MTEGLVTSYWSDLPLLKESMASSNVRHSNFVDYFDSMDKACEQEWSNKYYIIGFSKNS